MACRYLNETNQTLDIDSNDSYQVIIEELATILDTEWEQVQKVKLEGITFQEIGGVNQFVAIFNLISGKNTPNFSSLSLSESSGFDIPTLKNFINVKGIVEIDLSNYEFNLGELAELTELFNINQQLEVVDLHTCNLNDHGQVEKSALFNALKNCGLRELYLSGNDLSDADIDFLVELVSNGIESLDIGYNENLTVEGLQEFLERIAEIDDIDLTSLEIDDLRVNANISHLINNLPETLEVIGLGDMDIELSGEQSDHFEG